MKRYLFTVFLTVLALCVLPSCGSAVPGTEAADAVPNSSGAKETSLSESSHTESTASTGTDPASESSISADSGSADFAPDFTFETTDRNGNIYDETIFSGHKITILNFWETWCGPCVQEMPDLQKLYEDYRDQGLHIIGVYASPRTEEEVDTVLASTGVTYDILHYTREFDAFQTGYVPTTLLIDGSGHIVGDAIIGSHSYEDWENIVSEYLS